MMIFTLLEVGHVLERYLKRVFLKCCLLYTSYAKLDTHREIRSGFPEVVFCSGKADEHLIRIYETLYNENGEVFLSLIHI